MYFEVAVGMPVSFYLVIQYVWQCIKNFGKFRKLASKQQNLVRKKLAMVDCVPCVRYEELRFVHVNLGLAPLSQTRQVWADPAVESKPQ